jgi:hypothetical protein
VSRNGDGEVPEESPGGSRIFRHRPRERELEGTGGDEALIEGVGDHLTRWFGEDDDSWVFHEIVSDLVHVDVHFVSPTDERPWYTLVTSGMAERPMTVPAGLEDARHAELVLALPRGWPLGGEAFEEERHYWPVRLLKTLARLPHEYDTFLWLGHTVPNGDPPEPYADGTELCGAILLPPLRTPDGFDELRLADGRAVRFLGVYPLHADEMDLKLQRGPDKLADLLEPAGVTELLDPARPSVVPRKRRFWRR